MIRFTKNERTSGLERILADASTVLALRGEGYGDLVRNTQNTPATGTG